MAAAESVYQPPEKFEWSCEEQSELFYYGPKPLLASGGFGSSKTTAVLIKLLYLADLFPGYRTAIARRFSSELKQTTLQTFFKLCPPKMYEFGSKNEAGGIVIVTLNNGSRFTFMHLARPDASTIIRGLEINAAFLDQAEEMDEESFDMLEGRLGRWDKAKVPPFLIEQHKKETKTDWPDRLLDGRPMPPSYMLLTCNPELETHWLWRRFHQDSPEWQEKYSKMGYKMITFDTLKNKFRNARNTEILMSKDQIFVDRFVHGKWGNSEGVIFWVSDLSILEPTEDLLALIRHNCRLFRILDHGDSGITCCLWAAADGVGNLYIYREFYTSTNIRDARNAIYEMSKADGVDGKLPHYTGNYADPSIGRRVPQRVGGRDVHSRWSVLDEWADTKNYSKDTAIVWQLSDNDEMSSRERLSDYLRVKEERIHPATGDRGAPRLYFVKKTEKYPQGCQHAIIETRSARKVQIGSSNGRPIFSDERDEKIPDHALDCVRYLVLSRPAPSQPKEKNLGTMTWDGYSKLTKDWNKRRRNQSSSWR
jgi:Phage terminase large subunit